MSPTAPDRSLRRRDWLILPLIACATALAFVLAMEGTARVARPESKSDSCVDYADDARVKPSCTSTVKAAEGPWVENRYNECGYRGTGSCRPPAPGTARLVVVGSSTSWGYLVPLDEVWSVQAAQLIQARCGSPIDVQGLGGFGNLNQAAARLPEVVALHPQLVALVIAPFDLLNMPAGGFDPDPQAHAIVPMSKPADHGAVQRLRALAAGSRAILIAQEFAYLDPSKYTSTYLNYADQADFLRPPFTPAWAARLAYLEAAVAHMAARLRPSATPFLLVYAPQQAQADMIAGSAAPPGVDPRAMNHAIAAIAARHGVLFADGADAFAGVQAAPTYFYRADGHLNGKGHSLLAQAAASAVLAAHPPGLCSGRAS